MIKSIVSYTEIHYLLLKTFENLQKQMIELKEYNEMLKELGAQQITFDLDDGVTVIMRGLMALWR